MGSKFGADFDLFTDYCFGIGLGAVALPTAFYNGTPVDFALGLIFAVALISFSTAYNNAEKGSMRWEEYNSSRVKFHYNFHKILSNFFQKSFSRPKTIAILFYFFAHKTVGRYR